MPTWAVNRCDTPFVIHSLIQERKKSTTISHKIAALISVLAVAVWLIQHVNPNIFPVDPTYPAIAVFTLCEALLCWNNRRKWAYLLIAGAVISIACFLLEMML